MSGSNTQAQELSQDHRRQGPARRGADQAGAVGHHQNILPRRGREHLAQDAPGRYIATATKSKRNKKIFIDYLRNSREATAVAPYSTRARPGAPVSTPVDWSELGCLKGANQFTVRNLPARLSRLRKDPWANIGRLRQALPKLK